MKQSDKERKPNPHIKKYRLPFREMVKHRVTDKISETKEALSQKKASLSERGKSLKQDYDDIKNAHSAKERLDILKQKTKQRVSNANSVQQMAKKWKNSTTRAVLKAIGPVQLKIILSTIGILIVFLNMLFVFIGMGQAFEPTKHYYCDVNAPPELKTSVWYQIYCGGGGGDNSSIANAAIELATHDTTLGRPGETEIRSTITSSGMSDLLPYKGKPTYTIDSFVANVPKIVEMADANPKKTTAKWGASYYASCDLSVALAIWWSSADINYPALLGGPQERSGGTTSQAGYLANKGSKDWVEVKRGDKVLPGDVALGNRDASGDICHTWMYIATWENGKYTLNEAVQKKFPGSKATLYQGSHHGDSEQGGYYACLGADSNPWETSDRIFRFVGKIDEKSPIKQIGQKGK